MAGLRGWKKALKNAVDYPWDSDIDSDHPKCPRCGSTMDFHGHDDSGDFDYDECLLTAAVQNMKKIASLCWRNTSNFFALFLCFNKKQSLFLP